MIDAYRKFPKLRDSSPASILRFLLDFSKHSISVPNGFMPYMRPRVSDLASHFFSAEIPKSCAVAITRLFAELPITITDFFELSKSFIDAPSSFSSEKGSSLIELTFSRFNSIWQLYFLIHVNERNFEDMMVLVKSIFFQVYSYFSSLKNDTTPLLEIQQRIVESARKASLHSAMERERSSDKYSFMKSSPSTSISHSNLRKRNYETSTSSTPSVSSTTSSSKRSNIDHVRPVSNFNKKLRTYLSSHPLTEEEKATTLKCLASKKKLIDSDGFPLKPFCFHCGNTSHLSNSCSIKEKCKLLHTSPLIKNFLTKQ